MADLQSTIKSQDTEEWIDIVFTRPIGYLWALFFRRLGVHPNVVTVLSMILGAAAGVCFYFSPATSEHWLLINVCGVLLLMWANFYDSCDGQLARMTGQKTRLGRILDGAAGDIWYIAIYLALVFRLWNEPIPLTTTNWGFLGFALLAFDGLVCHTRQCRLADYYRNIHLFFLKGEAGSELDNYAQQKALYEQTPWRADPVWKFFLFTYVNYTRAQEQTTPQFQRLMRRLRATYGTDIPQSFRDRFRSLSRPILWCTNALTFNQRALALYMACLLNLPWLVFAFEIVYLGAIYFYMKRRHESFCRTLANEL